MVFVVVTTLQPGSRPFLRDHRSFAFEQDVWFCRCPNRDTINVGWDGRIFDCDFNQQLELGMGTAGTNAGASDKLRSVEVGARGSSCMPVVASLAYILHQAASRLLEVQSCGSPDLVFASNFSACNQRDYVVLSCARDSVLLLSAKKVVCLSVHVHTKFSSHIP